MQRASSFALVCLATCLYIGLSSVQMSRFTLGFSWLFQCSFPTLAGLFTMLGSLGHLDAP